VNSRRRWLPRTLRWRLTLAVGAVLILAFVATFAVVYAETDSRLRGEVDNDLRLTMRSFVLQVMPAAHVPPAQLARAAQRYVDAQPFSASSRLLFALIPGRRPITNQPEALNLTPHPDADDSATEAAAEAARARAIVDQGAGLRTLPAPDVGPARMLVERFGPGGRIRLGVAEPLASIDDALDGIQRGFAIGGSLTLAGALLVGFLLAAGFARPLSRIARVAARVDAGDLSPRIDARGARDETRVLADAFDHMLDRLEEAFARQQTFISDASHELRTPLTAIRGQLEVLARNANPDAEEVRRVQRLVVAEVDRMTRLTEDLLLLAHTDESRPVQREAIELEDLLDDLLASAEPTADRRFGRGEHADGIVGADRDRITQALRNLLRNAIEHTQRGGRIELGARASAGGRVAIWVDDDGPGIPADQRELVFHRFHRADPARARSAGGTGLGLAIVQAIATSHGGRAWAAQSPLGGARVVIELPGFRRISH
jgi:signal transduction histidine kinase